MYIEKPLQVAGHKDILFGDTKKVLLKKERGQELINYIRIFQQNWILTKYLPFFHGILDKSSPTKAGANIMYKNSQVWNIEQSDRWLCIENLLYDFESPCIVDIKVGKVRHNATMPKEKIVRSTAKCTSSSSGGLGLYICGASHMADARSRCNIPRTLYQFTDILKDCLIQNHDVSRFSYTRLLHFILQNLGEMRNDLVNLVSKFSIISSSILISYDIARLQSCTSSDIMKQIASVKLIDLSNCVDIEPHGYQDADVGFIEGLENLISSFQEIQSQMAISS